jgi:hypothetical protein
MKPPREAVPAEFWAEIPREEAVEILMRGYFDGPQLQRIWRLTGRDPATAPAVGDAFRVHRPKEKTKRRRGKKPGGQGGAGAPGA